MAIEHWIWLGQVLGYGSRSIKPLIDEFKTAEAFFEYCKGNNNINAPITKKELQRVHNITADDVYHISKRCNESGIEVIPYTDARYPERIKSISNPPTLLYVKGRMPDVDGECAITIVGPREGSDYGMKASFSLARRLGYAGCLIVSGGAMGIDAMAHKGALSVGRPTMAVLGCGINYDYPKGNATLREQIAANGCLISEYPPDYPPSKTTYPARNRILSAISCGTVVIEAGVKSGALSTANYAAEQDRDVFAIPGIPTLAQYAGSNKLLQDGARHLLTAADVLEVYYPIFPQKIDLDAAASVTSGSADYNKALEETNSKSSHIDTKAPAFKKPELDIELGVDARAVYQSVENETFTADDAVASSGLDINSVISALTELEIFGLITQLPGGRYKIS